MGPTAAVYLKTEVSGDVLDRFDALLRSIASEIRSTRKGRDWTIFIQGDDGGSRAFYVHVYDAQDRKWEDRLHDCLDHLDKLGIEPSEVSAYIVITAGCNQDIDGAIMDFLLDKIAECLNGRYRSGKVAGTES